MGLSNKKTTTNQTATTNQTSNATTTPTNPDWVTSALQGYTNKVNDIAGTKSSDYVAPTSPLQQQAYTGAGALNGNPTLDKAVGTASDIGTVNGESLLSGLSNYYNPYEKQVVDATKADLTENAGQVRAQQAASAGLNKAFSGSRYGIQEAQTEGELARAEASALGGLRYQGFNTAANLSSQDASRRQSASESNVQNKLAQAGLLGSLGTAQSADNRANIGLQSDLGDKQQAQDVKAKTSDLALAQVLAQLYGSGQYGLFQGSNSTGTQSGTSSGTSVTNTNPSLLSSIGQGAQTAASLAALFSDIRLKRDITPLGVRNGRKWYQYRYLWSDDLQEGVMAHENMDVAITDPSGFLKVDYGRIV